jgi:hypothetical protein
MANAERIPWQLENRFKNSKVSFIPNENSNKVLLAAIDWKNFQSLENAQALYMSVLKMLGEKPENIHMLDNEK